MINFQEVPSSSTFQEEMKKEPENKARKNVYSGEVMPGIF